jgi:hypothetical protein
VDFRSGQSRVRRRISERQDGESLYLISYVGLTAHWASEGKVVSSDSDEPSKHKKKKKHKVPGGMLGEEEEQKPAWKRPKKSKIRVEHKTYEEIVQDAGMGTAAAGVGQIIDATGAVVCLFPFFVL